MNDEQQTASIGKMMLLWAGLLLLAFWAWDSWFAQRANPNRAAAVNDGELRLQANARNMYLVPGSINGVEVMFLLDTGATLVSVPAGVARRAGLVKGQQMMVSTANGVVPVWRTRINNLGVSDFQLKNIDATINPHVDDNVLLLGMSALRFFSISQQQGELILRR